MEKSEYCLCLNAAEGLLQLLIARQETEDPEVLRLLCVEAWHAPSQGVELLIPALADALGRLRLVVGDIGRIACVRGPGSFTGLRLVLATAAGLARATGALQAGIEYLPLLAYSAWHRLQGMPGAFEYPSSPPEGRSRRGKPARQGKEQSLWVLTHARKDFVHMQGFSIPVSEGNGRIAAFAALLPLTGIHVCTPEEAAFIVQAHGEARATSGCVERPPLVLGSGLTRNYTVFAAAVAGSEEKTKASHGAKGHAVRRLALLSRDCDHPLPEALLDIAATRGYSSRDIDPLYVRPADAEDNLESIARSLGLDPEKARRKLSLIKNNTV
ncbi:MAG: tRNA (adenosine(37)-N6)-threonylcarbamoyltransferase complex dimerization subunit type 1 TsaB [Desulfovibrio sp.]|nr:tRNA (adenosine(37)-N6)-threonylcarbamoyltransferase complex dimerization subunit type 1 TsaB [Desulfovibrio sp.]